MKDVTRRLGLAVGLLGLVVSPMGQAHGKLILESATLGPTGQTGGYLVHAGQFLGARFTLEEVTEITQVGGHLGSYNVGNNRLFAAIVALDGPSALPAFQMSEIAAYDLASTTFAAPRPSADVLIDLPVTLGPGDYGLIFGSGAFGATGQGVMTTNNASTPQSSTFIGSGSFMSIGLSGTRFVVVGQEANTLSSPEPSTIALAASALPVALACWRRRRKAATA